MNQILISKRICLASFFLILGLVPGQSQKFLIATLDDNCAVSQSNYYRLRISSSKLMSPPDGLPGEKSNTLPVYYSRGIKNGYIPKDIWSSYLIPRERTLWDSPAFSWIEQRIAAISANHPTSQNSWWSKLMNNGQKSIELVMPSAKRASSIHGFSAWVDRFPLVIIRPDSDQHTSARCDNKVWSRIELYQRGFFLPWLRQNLLEFNRNQLDYVFHPKLKTAVAKFFPDPFAEFYFHVESARFVYFIGVSWPDLPLFLRAFLLILASFLFSSVYLATRKACKNNNENTICKILPLNIFFLCNFALLFFAVLEILLAKTDFLDELDSRKPAYYPLRDTLVKEHALREKMIAANEYGFTDDPVEVYDRQYQCKIAVLGDSFVWGSGFGLSNISNRWTSQLQSLIPACKILHWGIPGWGPEEQAEFMVSKGANHSVDLIVVGTVTNDFPDVSRLSLHRNRVKMLIDSLGTTPVIVALTPWSGLTSQHKPYFDLARKLYLEEGVKVESCLDDIQSIVGDAALPRSMWSTSLVQARMPESDFLAFRRRSMKDINRTVAVDRHPGMPVTREIAKCVYNFLRDEVSSSQSLSYLLPYLSSTRLR